MFDACSYVVVRRYAPDGPYPAIPVYAPGRRARAGVGAAAATARARSTTSTPSTTCAPGTFDVGPFAVTVDRVNHPVETYGVRIEHGGRVLAYSADTAPCDALNRLAQNADLFLCEASYLDGEDNPPDLHLTGRDAGEAAARAGRRPAAC